MSDFESMLTRWQSAGILDAGAADRIRAYEAGQKKPAGLRWEGLVALILGGILLACGVVLFVSAHWDDLGPGPRFALVMAMVAVFHIGGAATRERFHALSTTLHAVGTVATGAAIALVGQIFNIEEHWPAAVLLWAIAALAGWALLRDQAQQILALLLVPVWMLSELFFYSERHIGEDVYIGRFLFVWAVLYLTFFLGSQRKAVQGILFVAAAIAAVAGTVLLLRGWTSWYGMEGFFPFGTRVWGWIAIAFVPLIIAAFKGHKGLIPPAAAIAFVLALPWCQRHWIQHFDFEDVHNTYTRYGPNLLAHALVAAFAIFLTWWGVRQASRALVNLGMLGFAIAVGWFYFSDIFDKIGRSLGLIGLGILFLLGGWALEKMRRRLITAMNSAAAQEAL
ncbi:MAG TPA: DUF2157 domain-containing protein [Terracidiphilus sp.]|jgi:uncharacterized membrane protein|nr:DUF2157 domain-containing protein [Terracidiphilus sp.]